MGFVFALARDEELDELDKTRLDLERARMEREDFRSGSGIDTRFMHEDVAKYGGSNSYKNFYNYTMRREAPWQFEETARKRVKEELETIVQLKAALDKEKKEKEELKLALVDATQTMARILRGGPALELAEGFFLNEDPCHTNEAVEKFADDGKGRMDVGLGFDEDPIDVCSSDEDGPL
jgi:hypothetical protein